MPVLAARLADVLGANPDPLVGGGVGDHPLDQRPRLLLGGAAALELRPGFGEAVREGIAHLLELADAEQARSAGGADPPLDLRSGRRREQLRKLPLHAGDLRPQGTASRLQILRRAAGDAPRRWSLK